MRSVRFNSIDEMLSKSGFESKKEKELTCSKCIYLGKDFLIQKGKVSEVNVCKKITVKENGTRAKSIIPDENSGCRFWRERL